MPAAMRRAGILQADPETGAAAECFSWRIGIPDMSFSMTSLLSSFFDSGLEVCGAPEDTFVTGFTKWLFSVGPNLGERDDGHFDWGRPVVAWVVVDVLECVNVE